MKSNSKYMRPFSLNFTEDMTVEELDASNPVENLKAYEKSGLKKIHDASRELLNSGHSKLGAVAFGAIDAEQVLTNTFEQIDEILLQEMQVGNPKTAQDLTPKQTAIAMIDGPFQDLCGDAERKIFDEISVSTALGLGAALMRLAIENPGSELAAKLDKLLGIDFSKAAELGMERVIKKRDKRKQDKRKSETDAKRKSAAIATMKKLVGELGQVKASEEVERRMNKRHYESNGAIQKILPVSPGTIKRWYNAKFEKERIARKAAAEARLGRRPS
ncbi:MAG: hypothetical protein EOL90_00080 [Spartobacteria bacterium]|nr:hypothetical protein [Spartobacteria bacterium]